MPSITAILVTYNSGAVIAPALGCIASCPQVIHSLIVDNSSSDDTIAVARAAMPAVEIIASASNDGFGVANNVALERVSTDFALLVNPDALLNEAAIAELLAAAARYPEAAILAPLHYSQTGVYYASHKQNVFAREVKRTPKHKPEGDLCVDYVSGAVMLFRMEALRRIGFFDPEIFLYYEDDDICLRARAAGMSVVLVAGAAIVHQGGGSTRATGTLKPLLQQHMQWSRLYLERKYKGVQAAQKLALRLRRLFLCKYVLYTLAMNGRKASIHRARLMGIEAYLQGKKPQKP